nr:Chain C, GAG PEPTIDE [synthetic construct]5NMF_C Chain C, Gag protein [Human immunodeficiency virus 1]5NMF_H Chain H, Gag protein [Human immunodeficiency virus 1]5NMH_C Chain C, Gag protein [Human immunodeficiency virus 1]
SLYNTIATL